MTTFSRWAVVAGMCAVTCFSAPTHAQFASEPAPSPGAGALDVRASGFATLGYAISDQPWRWQRFTDEGGTFWRDSILGGQIDARWSPSWSGTVQLTLAPSTRAERQWAVEAAWAFVSWRPDNDWLVRLGKQRVPIFLNAENRDVGQTYAFVRLPAEVYALTPTSDHTGVSLTRTWQRESGELSADAYAGRAQINNRSSSRDLGASYLAVHTDIFGAALTWRSEALSWRMGLHRATTRRADGQPFLQGRRVTGFTNAEEFLARLKDVVPFLLEDEMKARGADFHSALLPLLSHVEEDGNLITGQNPRSSEDVAALLVKRLTAR